MNPNPSIGGATSNLARYIGLDLGGTKIMTASADTRGVILQRLRADTPRDREEGLKLIKNMLHKLSRGGEIAAIGAAVGGPLDWKTGVVSPLHQPEWNQVPLKTLMEAEYNCPFYLDVDTNVAVLGEFRFGGESARRLLYLTVSTGVGGGLMIDGRIYRGAEGAHPEPGHHAIPYRCRFPERVICECGGPDCLEALVSGNGIRRIYGKPAEDLLQDEWQEVGDNLGLGLYNLSILYAPDVIVLGGGVATGGGEKLLAPARRVLNDRLKYVPVPEVRLSRLGYDTALLGAIALAMEGGQFFTP